MAADGGDEREGKDNSNVLGPASTVYHEPHHASDIEYSPFDTG